MSFSIKLADDIRRCLFARNDHDFIHALGVVTYDVKPGCEEQALKTWAVHGVCLQCKRWTITAGRCAECDLRYNNLLGFNAEKMVQEQVDLAKTILRQV